MDWKFETYVEKIKFDVLKEVARASYAGNFREIEHKLPEILIPGRKPSYRCCVYMERAIMAERVKITRGGEWDDFNIIDVIPIACDQCPMGGYTVTESCRSCIGHACKQACPKNAISVDAMHRAHIDKEKCVNCGLCAKACPFGAIYNFRRPCQKACPVGAITMDENLSAKIDYSKCITCGQCTQKCPFGAIVAKTFVTFVIDHIRNNILATKKRPIFAIVAPSIVAQFPGVSIEQVIEGITLLGFTNVAEAALGADVVTMNEAQELKEKKLLTSSCCPAFVDYILRFHPELKDKISHSLSPAAQTGKLIKEKYPDALTVFIGPCEAKKMERSKPEVRPYVDYVLTFVELRAMFSARDVDVETLKGISLDQASPFGRNFARAGGLSDAVVQALKELNINDFKVSSLTCSGMKDCIKALESLSLGTSKYNFIEGMACEGGCVCGVASLNHNTAVGKAFVQTHARMSSSKTISDAIAKSKGQKIENKEVKEPENGKPSPGVKRGFGMFSRSVSSSPVGKYGVAKAAGKTVFMGSSQSGATTKAKSRVVINTSDDVRKGSAKNTPAQSKPTIGRPIMDEAVAATIAKETAQQKVEVKPAEPAKAPTPAVKPTEVKKPEVVKPAEPAKAPTPAVEPTEVKKPEVVKPAESAKTPTPAVKPTEVKKPEVVKTPTPTAPAVKPVEPAKTPTPAVKPTEVKKPEVAKPAEPAKAPAAEATVSKPNEIKKPAPSSTVTSASSDVDQYKPNPNKKEAKTFETIGKPKMVPSPAIKPDDKPNTPPAKPEAEKVENQQVKNK